MRLSSGRQASIAKLDGLPPKISVTMTTPAPLSTLSAAEQISSCLAALSSSSFIETAVMPTCFPSYVQVLQDIPALSHREQQLQYQSKVFPN